MNNKHILALLPLFLTVCERDDPTVFDWMQSECLNCTAAEELSMCQDGLDNDEDGLTDCEDPDCRGIGCCGRLGPENTDEACSDGCDNDGNGYVDCLDFGCSRNPAVSVCKSEVQEDEDTPEGCSDGIDNDWNGYIDCADRSCQNAPAVTFCEGSNATCSDGIDNDGNGFTDCDDFSCSRNTNVTVCD